MQFILYIHLEKPLPFSYCYCNREKVKGKSHYIWFKQVQTIIKNVNFSGKKKTSHILHCKEWHDSFQRIK